jgi:transposase
MRKKIPALRDALASHVDAHHRLWIGAILRHIDFLDEQIDQLTDMIEAQIRPFSAAVELLCTIPGIQHRGAQCIIGEIGTDMTRFATARHLASWAGLCPGNDKSAGKRRSGKTRVGTRAVRLGANWALARPGIARLEALVEPDNQPSQRLLVSAGFAREGVLRSFLSFADRRADAIVFSRVRDNN